MSLLIFGGSLEFIAIGMLLSPFAPLTALAVSFAVQARHLFYGISMLDRFRGTGWMKPYLIFGMCDETFSILFTTAPPEGTDRRWFMFWVTALNHFYWVSGATMGGLFGSFVSFNTDGLSFVMTALFVVILMNQWEQEDEHWTALIGAAASVICLVALGPDDFLLAALALILGTLTLLRRRLDRRTSR